MSEYEMIIAVLRQFPFLMVDRREVAFISKGETIGCLAKVNGPMMMHAESACERFSRLEGVGRDGECIFTAEQIATIAGTTVAQVEAWEADGLLTPSAEEHYSFADAFAAGLIGSMRREAIPIPLQRLIQPLVRGLLVPEAVEA